MQSRNTATRRVKNTWLEAAWRPALDRTAEGDQAKVIFSDRNSRGDMPSVARKSREKYDESARPQRAAILWDASSLHAL
jgi:hypothetical protein